MLGGWEILTSASTPEDSVMRPLPARQVFGEVLKQLTHQADLGKVPLATDVWGQSPDGSVCQSHASSPKSD